MRMSYDEGDDPCGAADAESGDDDSSKPAEEDKTQAFADS